jgi:hypothetical protein
MITPVRRNPECLQGRLALCLLFAILSLSPTIYASALAQRHGPVPPCAGDTVFPVPAAIGPTPAVEVWYGAELGRPWQPPECLGWQPMNTAIAVAAAGRFRDSGGADAVFARFTKISRLTSMRYWSVTRQIWRQLVPAAHALTGPDPAARREDFLPGELAAGDRYYYWQNENSPAGDVVYRVEIRALSPDRIVLAVENALPVRFLLLPLFEKGEYQFLYFLEREDGDQWRYYSLLRAADSMGVSGEDHEASFINRAVAAFRHVSGIAGDAAPPVAP